MTDPHTQLHLLDVEDVARANGLGHRREARVAGPHCPGRRSPFVHRHERAKELYTLLRGTGTVRLDGELTVARASGAGRQVRVCAPAPS